MGKTVVKFDSQKWGQEILQNAINEQTRRLIEYAEKEIKVIGDKIQEYHSANHMDRTGNLLNSLCWVLSYNGKKTASGFYRPETYHNKGREGTSASYLHEFFKNDMESVDGRRLAQSFIDTFKSDSNGWRIAFAILAPYWGYWEGGFTMKMKERTVYQNDDRQRRTLAGQKSYFLRHQVMVHVFDDVRMTLRPSAKVHLTVYVPKYSYKNPKYKKKKGYMRIGVQR